MKKKKEAKKRWTCMTKYLVLKNIERQLLPSKLHLHSQSIFSCPSCFIDQRTDPSDPIQSTHTQPSQMLSQQHISLIHQLPI